MKTWHVSYFWHGAFGAYEDYEFVVIAETKEKAIGMAVQAYPDTVSDMSYWSATEILIDTEQVYQVAHRCN